MQQKQVAINFAIRNWSFLCYANLCGNANYVNYKKYQASTGKNKLLRFVHPKQTNPVILHLQDWQTVDREAFTIRANNQRSFKLKEAIEEGSYNILMQNQPLYNSEAHTFESSHNLFRSAFSEGFPWELLEVFSGNVKFIISKKLD